MVFKYKLMFPHLKVALLTIVISSFLLSCATKNTKTESTLTINPELLQQSPEDVSFWMMFALGQSGCSDKSPVYTFGHFSCAFQLASLLIDEESVAKSLFQRELKQIIDAGYLKEYMFNQYNQPIWFPLPGLRNSEYKDWMETNLPNHQPGDPSSVSMNQQIEEQPDIEKEVQLSDGYIKEIGNLKFVKQSRYEKRSLGVQLRYDLIGVGNGWLDFFVYPNQRSSEKNELVDVLTDEASSSKSAIMYQARKYNAETMEILEESFNTDANFLTGIYLITVEGNSFANELYLSGNQKYFVKARSTFLFDRKNFYSSEVEAILKSLLTNVK